MSIIDRELDREYELGKRRLFQAHNQLSFPKLARAIKEDLSYELVNLNVSSKWDDIKQSKFIESILIGIPLIPIVLWEISYNKYKIIDGQERIKTSLDFYANKLILNGLDIRKNLNGFNYENLPYKDKDLIDRRGIKLVEVLIPPEWGANQDEIEQMIKIISTRLGH